MIVEFKESLKGHLIYFIKTLKKYNYYHLKNKTTKTNNKKL